MQWETKKLEDLADFYLGKMLDKKKNKGDYRPYLANVNVRWGGFELDDLREMRFEDREKERYGLEYGDIVMCEGGEPGRCAIWKNQIPGMMFQKALHRIRPNATLDYRFLYYSFLNRGQEGGFDQYCTGATIKHLPRQNLAKVEVAVPPLETQRAIASILSAYDDLIENNTRRIEILEEMARRLYEEWFVHFRFPGHEEVSFKESELGEIPEGWEVGTLQDVIVLQRGFDLPVKKRTPGDFPIVSATGVSGTHVEAKIDGPGVVTGRSGSIGKVMYVHGSYWPLNTTLWGKAFPLGSSLFAFYTLSAIDLKGFNVGAAVPTLNRNDIHGLPVILPAKEVVQLFDQVAGPIHELVVTLEKKSANLRTQRDLLLPKLVSGEIDVSDITMPEDKEVEAA